MSAQEKIISSEVEEALEEEDQELSFVRRNVKIRYILAIMGFFGFLILNILRVSMSIGIVSMVDWENLPSKNVSEKVCRYSENTTRIRTIDESGPYKWKPYIQGHILACYFYGLIVTQYYGGKFAERISAKYMLLVGILMSSVGTAVTPPLVNAYAYAAMLVQVIKGLGQGFIIPSFSVLVGKWIPKSERFVSMCVIGSGIPLGGFFGLALGGIISASEALGWPYIFYIYGGVGLIWSFFWLVLIYDSPLTHPYITQHEMIKILQSQTILPIKEVTPYSYIFSSLPVWAYIFVGFASYWALSIYTLVIPLFLGTILKYDIEFNGIMSSIPHVLEMFIFLCSCFINNALKQKEANQTICHKVSIGLSLIGFAACLLGVTLSGCNRIYTVSLLAAGLGLCGFCFASTSSVPVELTTRYAGFISAVMNTVGALSGIIVPTMIGYLTNDERTMEKWAILFYTSIAISLFAAIFYLIFGSCQTQPWNDPAYTRPQDAPPPQNIQIEKTPDGQVEISLVTAEPEIPEDQKTIVLKAPAKTPAPES